MSEDQPKDGRGDVLRRLLHMSGALANALDTDEAFALLLEGVGGAFRCAFASCWQAVEPGGPLICRAWWQQPGLDLESFRVATMQQRMHSGQGLPGRVWAERRAIWIEDVASDPDLPRVAAARAAGFHGGLAFPIIADQRVIAVLDFFSRNALRRDDDTLHMLDVLGAQIGEFVRRMDAEAALAEADARFRIFAETAADAIFTTDADSTILYTNPAVERVFGYTQQELVGRNLTMLIPARFREQHQHGVRRHIETGERHIPWSGVQLPGLHRDGHEVPLEISFGEFVQGSRHYFTGIARDISDRVRQHDEAIEAREEAERANRVKSEFLATMSHELRTPLNAMIGYSDLLLAGIPEPVSDAVAEKVRRIAASAQHLRELIEEILTFSRVEAGEERVAVDDVELGAVVDEVVVLMEPLAVEADLAFHLERPDHAVRMRSDARKIRQILFNLLANAVKFTPEGSVTLAIREAGDAVVISVRDTGPGIEAGDLAMIFEPFWQADSGTTRTAQGTGLGLAVSGRLAALLGGKIDVESEVGVGTTFTLTLPVHSAVGT